MPVGHVRAALEAAGIETHAGGTFLRQYAVDERYFATISDERRAYWLGFLAADGFVTNNGYVVGIQISAKDRAHLESFRVDVASEHPIRETINTSGFPMVSMVIGSRAMALDLAVYGIVPSKTLILDWIGDRVPAPLRHHFGRGYMDGDGSLTEHMTHRAHAQRRFQVVGMPAFLRGLQGYLEQEIGVPPNQLITEARSRAAVVQYTGNRVVSRIVHLLYQDATVYLERKRAVVADLLEHGPPSKRLTTTGLTKEQEVELVRRYVENLEDQRSLAREFGLERATVRRLLARHGAPLRGRAKWPPEKEREMVELFLNGWRLEDIAAHFGRRLTAVGVGRVLRRHGVTSADRREGRRTLRPSERSVHVRAIMNQRSRDSGTT